MIEKSVEKFSIHLNKICVSWEGTKCGLFTRIKTTLAKQEELLNLIQTRQVRILAFPTGKTIFPQPIVNIFYKRKSR
ncbi:hypothetical protein EFY79_11595 [Hanamia caeni]|uniref:Uncharacterized protein n=1 Tax=Hanamia caeni TaxID=2294116 RepID=A0A3M9NEW1_9BACT|nr:hypothetical protein EFY79_11595 [Hanamia caeni]